MRPPLMNVPQGSKLLAQLRVHDAFAGLQHPFSWLFFGLDAGGEVARAHGMVRRAVALLLGVGAPVVEGAVEAGGPLLDETPAGCGDGSRLDAVFVEPGEGGVLLSPIRGRSAGHPRHEAPAL